MLQNFIVRHVEDDKSIWENAFPLHCQSLNSGPGKTWKNETFLFLLNALYLFLHELDNNIILDDCVMFEVWLNLLSQFLFFRHFFLEKISHRYGCELIMVAYLQCKLSDFEPWRANDEYFFSWMKLEVLWGVDNFSIRKDNGSLGCLTTNCLTRSSKRS